MARVLHKSWIRKNAFGGITTGTQCNRFAGTKNGMNIADRDEDVTCSYCRHMMENGRTRPSLDCGA
jgi:hypothetical protein